MTLEKNLLFSVTVSKWNDQYTANNGENKSYTNELESIDI